MLLDWLGGVQPVAHVVVVCVLEAKVVLLYDVHLVMDFLQKLLPSGVFLENTKLFSRNIVVMCYELFTVVNHLLQFPPASGLARVTCQRG